MSWRRHPNIAWGQAKQPSFAFRAPPVSYAGGSRACYGVAMRQRFEIRLYEVTLVLCAAALAALVFTEGWIWPLQAAAVMIPVSLLFG
jgi:hypothetical protein